MAAVKTNKQTIINGCQGLRAGESRGVGGIYKIYKAERIHYMIP